MSDIITKWVPSTVITIMWVIVLSFGFWTMLNYRPPMQLIHNNKDIAVRLLKQDVELMTENSQLTAVTLSGCEWLWGPVKDDLKEAVGRGARLTFIVGPRFHTSDSSTIKELGSLPGVRVFVITEDPPVDIRLIDDKHLYVAQHGLNENKERKCWHSTPQGVPLKELRDVKQCIKHYEAIMQPLS